MFSFFAFLNSAAWQSGLLHAVLAGPLGLMLLDLVTGVSAAVKGGSFAWPRLADILKGDVLKYLGGGLTVGAVSTGLHWSADANLLATLLTMLGLSASTIASILTNIGEMLPAPQQGVVAPLLKDAESFLQEIAVDQKPTVSVPVVRNVMAPTGSGVIGNTIPQAAPTAWQLPGPHLS